MPNRYHRKEVLEDLYNKLLTVSDNVFVASRPVAWEQMDSFVVIRLPHGISPYADPHSISTVQVVCFVRDKQGGIEDTVSIERLVDGVISLLPFDDAVMRCNDHPLVIDAKADGMGFHSTIIQFKVIIKT